MQQTKINNKTLERAADRSSKIEGGNLRRAKKNTWLIKKLRQYDRALPV